MGKEKIIISQERLAYNKLYTHKDSKYILITEVKSVDRNSFKPAKNTYVKLLHNRKPKKLDFEFFESESENTPTESNLQQINKDDILKIYTELLEEASEVAQKNPENYAKELEKHFLNNIESKLISININTNIIEEIV